MRTGTWARGVERRHAFALEKKSGGGDWVFWVPCYARYLKFTSIVRTQKWLSLGALFAFKQTRACCSSLSVLIAHIAHASMIHWDTHRLRNITVVQEVPFGRIGIVSSRPTFSSCPRVWCLRISTLKEERGYLGKVLAIHACVARLLLRETLVSPQATLGRIGSCGVFRSPHHTRSRVNQHE